MLLPDSNQNSNLQVQLQLQFENPEVASVITHPSSGCTHPRLLVDPLDGTLVGWLAGLLADPLVGEQMLPLEHLDQRAEDEGSWIHQLHIQAKSYLNLPCYCCSMNPLTYASAEIAVPNKDQYRHRMLHDQWTFLRDPYGHAVGGLPYGMTTGMVAMACGNVAGGGICSCCRGSCR